MGFYDKVLGKKDKVIAPKKEIIQHGGCTPKVLTNQVVQTREGSVEKVPVNNSDMANKKYVDDEITDLTAANLANHPHQNVGIDASPSFVGETLSGGNAYLYFKDTDNYIYVLDGSQMDFRMNGLLAMRINNDASLVINENGYNVNFRVESDTKESALFVAGSTGNVGIGTSVPAQKLEIAGGNITSAIYETGFRFLPYVASSNGGRNFLFDQSANAKLYIQGYVTNGGTADAGGSICLEPAGGKIGIGMNAPTAVCHLRGGTTGANTAPLKFGAGNLLITPEAGAVEFVTDDFYGTITTEATRKKFVLDNGVALTSGRVPFATTNGRLTDDADLTFATDTLTATKVKAGTVAGFISSDGSAGATGTFTTVDSKTVTVKDGIITSIV